MGPVLKTLILPALALIAAGVASGAAAHHSFARFDSQRTLVLKGTVKSFEMVNPHSWLHVAAVETGGRPVEWALEMGDPAQLTREGWTKDSVKPGDKVSVSIHPRLDGSHGGQLIYIVLPDGRELDADRPFARLAP